MENKFDVIVIGGGPGGYVAAIKSAKEGFKTALVEDIRVGGTCLNRGCIPAKAMIHASHLYREAKEASRFGVYCADVTYNYEEILTYKESTTDKLVSGVEQLLKSNGVTQVKGHGTLEEGNKVSVKCGEEVNVYEADKVIIATGSKPVILPLPGMDLKGVLTSDELFQLREVPESLAIIGGGVISVEFASVFAALGSKVTIVEAMPRLLPNMDKEISQNLKMILKKRGVDSHTGASVKSVSESNGMLSVNFEEKGKEVSLEAQYVLCAVGRRPNTEGLFGENVSLEMDRNFIKVDDNFKTSMDNVYAIGDVVRGMQLAHVASAQGIYVVEKLANKETSINLSAVPGCVYTDPEIASVGLTEEEAKEKDIEVKVGKFIMSANGKSLITQEERGFIKVVVDANTDVVLGAAMMCARATDMVGEFVTAVANKLTAHDLIRGMRAHPTYNEGIGEALEDAMGEAIHIAPKRRR